MHAIFLIMAKEFKSSVATPMTASIVFFFLLFMGWFFSNFIETFVAMQQRAPMMGGQTPTIEQLMRAMFYNLHFTLVLIIPALTMGVIAEEKKLKSMRFLLAAPISSTVIVLGKFLCVCLIMTLVVLLSSVYPVFLAYYGNPDIGVIYGSYLGLFLLIVSQLSFGMWVSSLCKNQLVAFVFTMLGLFLMLVVDFIAPSITKDGIVEDFIRYFSTTKHLEVFFNGVISIADLSYFVILTFGFLFLTVVSLDSQRWS